MFHKNPQARRRQGFFSTRGKLRATHLRFEIQLPPGVTFEQDFPLVNIESSNQPPK